MKFNGLKTTLLLGVMSGMLLMIGQVLGGSNGLVIGFGFAVLMNFASYFFSEKIALSMYQAQPVTPADNPQVYARVYPMTQQFCQRMGIPVPKLWVIPEHSPNAFATGRNPSHSSVAFTIGLLELMNDSEVEGVLAHELGHIKNRDILTSSVAATIGAAITMLARFAMFIPMGRSDDDDEGSNPLAGLFMMILAPIAAMLIQMAISRTREFAADATAAKYTGTPDGLISGLKKLESWSQRIPDGRVAGHGAHVHHQAVQRLGVHEAVLDASSDRGASRGARRAAQPRVLGVNRVKVNRKAADRIASGHPWIYTSDVVDRGDAEPGDAVLVFDPRDRLLGTFHYSSSSQITLRQLSSRERTIDRFFLRRPHTTEPARTEHESCATARRIAWYTARRTGFRPWSWTSTATTLPSRR